MSGGQRAASQGTRGNSLQVFHHSIGSPRLVHMTSRQVLKRRERLQVLLRGKFHISTTFFWPQQVTSPARFKEGVNILHLFMEGARKSHCQEHGPRAVGIRGHFGHATTCLPPTDLS